MKSIILVHPTISIKYLFPFLKKQKYTIFSIITRLENTQIETDYIVHHSDFVLNGSTDPEQDLPLIKEIIQTEKLDIKAIINGLDASLYYADFLQKTLLGLPLDLECSKLRMNKYQVNKALIEHNLAAIPTIEITHPSKVQNHLREINQLGFPLIAKPSENTAVMAAVEMIHSMQDITIYLEKYFNKQNTYYKDKIINKIILQKYIPLEEYVIDFISYAGKHYCCGLATCVKSTEGEGYQIDRQSRTFTLSEIPGITSVVNYVSHCLDALGVEYGLTHNEVFWDGANEFYLIESNNRFGGNYLIEMYHYTYGHNPVERYIEFCSGQTTIGYNVDKRKEHCVSVDLYNKTVPVVSHLNVKDLSSFKRIIHFRKKDQNPPDFYKHYKRVEHICASILLSNPLEQDLEEDITHLIDREQESTLFLP